MKAPISKQLTDILVIPFTAITGVGLYDLYLEGQKPFVQNIVIIILFGLPSLLFVWFLLDKRFEFKDNKKVRKSERVIKLPFSSFSTLIIFIISSSSFILGIDSIFGEKDTSGGLLMLITSLTVIILAAVANEHPKIWFSDTLNVYDILQDIKNVPQENFTAYQEGIFSFSDNSFTIQLEKENKTINWEDIVLIKAYKIDQYTYDCIVIEIHLEETFISINDQSTGYMKFMETASNKLSNFKKEWFRVVAFPAFETNLTIVYERQNKEKI